MGATGPKLLFEGARVQHAGLVYGSGTITHSYYRAAHPQVVGAYGELWINREVTALTGACIAVTRTTFEEVGGFTEELPVNYNDVDFCLKLRTWATGWSGCTTSCSTTSSRSPGPTRCGRGRSGSSSDRWGDYLEVEERFSINVR